MILLLIMIVSDGFSGDIGVVYIRGWEKWWISKMV